MTYTTQLLFIIDIHLKQPPFGGGGFKKNRTNEENKGKKGEGGKKQNRGKYNNKHPKSGFIIFLTPDAHNPEL